MNNEPVAFWNKDFDLWEENAIQTYKADGWNIPLYTHPVKEQELLAEIESLKEVNAKQADYIAEQKLAYEKLWSEHMELFWKHEQDTDLTNE